MKTETTSYLAVEKNFADIRIAIENRAYDDLHSLLAEQRVLIGNLPLADPEAQACFVQAQDLTAWSLSMVKMQRSALQESLSTVAQLKQVDEYRQSVLSV